MRRPMNAALEAEYAAWRARVQRGPHDETMLRECWASGVEPGAAAGIVGLAMRSKFANRPVTLHELVRIHNLSGRDR